MGSLDALTLYFGSLPVLLALSLIATAGLLASAPLFRNTTSSRARLRSLSALLVVTLFLWIFLALSFLICLLLSSELEYGYTAAKVVFTGAVLGGLALTVLVSGVVWRRAPARALRSLDGREVPIPPALATRWVELRQTWDLPSARLHINPEKSPNSWAVDGSGGHVVISRALCDLLTGEEMDAVLAHELAHLAHGDSRHRLFERTLSRILFFDPVSRLVAPALNREREFLADETAAATLQAHQSLAAALAKIERTVQQGAAAVSSLGIHGPGRGLLSFHPPIRERIERLLRAAPTR